MVFLKYHEFWCEVLEKNKNENSPFKGDELGENKSRTKRSATNKLKKIKV